jgi:hypothetical protein
MSSLPIEEYYPGVYRIPYECGRVYIGQTGRSVDIRLKEHQRHIRLEHPDKSAVAEHSFLSHGVFLRSVCRLLVAANVVPSSP